MELADRVWTIAVHGCMTEVALTLSRLGVVLYRNRGVLREHAVPVLAGLCLACAARITVALLSAGWLDLPIAFAAGPTAKPGITTVAIEIVRVIVSDLAFVSGCVFATGVFGAMFGAFLLTSTRMCEASWRGPSQEMSRYGAGARAATGKLQIQNAVAAMALLLATAFSAALVPGVVTLAM
jgi:putative effector of murein hydrolase